MPRFPAGSSLLRHINYITSGISRSLRAVRASKTGADRRRPLAPLPGRGHAVTDSLSPAPIAIEKEKN